MEATNSLAYLDGKFIKSKKSQLVRNILLTAIPFITGIVWLVYSVSKVQELNKERASLVVSIQSEKRQLDSLQRKKNQLQVQYLEAKGFDSDDQALLGQSIKADTLLRNMSDGNIAPGLRIQYFIKTLDQEKVSLALKELGYNNIINKQTTKKTLEDKGTNAIFYGRNVGLHDIKTIALVLMRAGVKLQQISRIKNDRGRENVVQIGSYYMEYEDGRVVNDSPVISPEQIRKANDISELDMKY